MQGKLPLNVQEVLTQLLREKRVDLDKRNKGEPEVECGMFKLFEHLLNE